MHSLILECPGQQLPGSRSLIALPPRNFLPSCQVYASAVPVSYAQFTDIDDFEPFARLVLESAYDATLLAARVKGAQQQAQHQAETMLSIRTKVFLTMLGGGAFGNRMSWIADAINKALDTHREAPLDVFLVSYRQVDPRLRSLMPEWKNGKPGSDETVQECCFISICTAYSYAVRTIGKQTKMIVK